MFISDILDSDKTKTEKRLRERERERERDSAKHSTADEKTQLLILTAEPCCRCL